jgi:hypothetical protein
MAPEKLEKANMQDSDYGGEKTSSIVKTVEMSRDVELTSSCSFVARCATNDVTQWAATFTTMNFVSGMPVLFGFAMYVCAAQWLDFDMDR